MFYQKKEEQKVYAEITNPIHGGLGWNLGYCLWVPTRDKSGSDSWAIMREVSPNDLIIHLVKRNEKDGYKFCGVSLAKESYNKVESEPPRPGKYKGMSPYYRIELDSYMPFDKEIPVDRFFKKHNSTLHAIYQNIKSTFYVEYGKKKELRMSQKYLTHIPQELFKLINNFFAKKGINYRPEDNYDHKPREISGRNPIQSDWVVPDRVTTETTRIIRDSKLIREVKKEVDHKCQICGKKILLPSGNYYSEGHHLRPLGGDHKGPDIKKNIIILCPNHHNQFDYGSIAIKPQSKKIKHINPNNDYDGKDLAYNRKSLGNEFLKFHFDEIYNQL